MSCVQKVGNILFDSAREIFNIGSKGLYGVNTGLYLSNISGAIIACPGRTLTGCSSRFDGFKDPQWSRSDVSTCSYTLGGYFRKPNPDSLFRTTHHKTQKCVEKWSIPFDERLALRLHRECGRASSYKYRRVQRMHRRGIQNQSSKIEREKGDRY